MIYTDNSKNSSRSAAAFASYKLLIALCLGAKERPKNHLFALGPISLLNGTT
jgi:hypothetical protein